MTRPSERLKNTKLSSAPAKGLQVQTLKQSLKLENADPLKRSVKGVARKLKAQMAGRLANKSSEKGPSAADNSKPGETAALKKLPFVKDTKGSRLALNLLLVRPWFLLAGFWVVSLVSAAVAWEGMISPRILTMDLPQQAVENAPAAGKNSFLSVEQAPESGSSDVEQSAPTESANAKDSATNAADSAGGFPTWPLGALVGTCAAGCLAISRRRAMVRLAATRSKGKRRVRPNAAPQASHKKTSPLVSSSKMGRSKAGRPLKVVATRKPKRSVPRIQPKGQPNKGQPARLNPVAVHADGQSSVRGLVKPKKRRQRRRLATAQSVPRPAAGAPVLASRTSASRPDLQRSQAAPTAQNRLQKRRKPSVRSLKRNQSVVSVVPASESNALDWRNGSLAHQLDVRPQRTASM